MAAINLAKLLGSPQVQRWHEAAPIKSLDDIDFPKLSVWNYEPCEHHTTPDPECMYRACGGNPFKHQKKTALFSYITRGSLVGNSTGTGKTNSALLTLALAHRSGEKIKALVVVPSTAVVQWESETKRWAPGFKVASIPPKTPKQERLRVYSGNWDLLIIGYHAMARDVPHISKIKIQQLIVDDIDPALNVTNTTFEALEIIAQQSEIVVMMNATLLGTHLLQLYAASCLIGGQSVWGSIQRFTSDYIKKAPVWIYPKKGSKSKWKGNIAYDSEGREMRKVMQAVGYQNMEQFKAKFEPMYIRYTYEDLAGDLTIPDLMTQQIYLDMHPKQRHKYEQLQDGIRTLMDDNDMPAAEKAVTALTAFTYGSQICSGTFALKTSTGGYEPDHVEASPKLDWIIEKLKTDWPEEKVVIYSKFRGSIAALQGRLDKEGIGHATISGAITDPVLRKQAQDSFWTDPSTQVMIISVSGERSLNLQVSRILVMWDLQLNPARVTQLAGRVRRIGSKHKKVFVFELLHYDSQEERYMTSLSARQHLFDYVFDIDDSEEDPDTLLIQKLPTEDILRLISP